MGPSRSGGMRAFTIIWFGQVLSLIGSSVTAWALGVWAYDLTGQATTLTLVAFSSMLPTMLLSPIAGAMVDRYNRKLVLALSDMLAGVASAGIFLLYIVGSLQVWHLYAAGALVGIGGAFQFPAYSAAMSAMIPKEQLGRANGMLSLAESGGHVLGPILGAVLVAWLGLGGVLAIDLVTFGIALVCLLMVHIPQPPRTVVGESARGSLLKESMFGLRYIFAIPSLLGLQLMFFMLNLTSTVGWSISPALLLDRAGPTVQSVVLSVSALGGVAGGLLMSAWGGPKRRIHGVLVSMFIGSFASVFFGFGRTALVWITASFVQMVAVTVLNASNQAIWQSKVPLDIQGRVFAARRMIAQITIPVSLLITGPLVDHILEPGMAQGGALAGLFGGLLGTGMGSGKALITIIAGLIGAAGALTGYLRRPVREVETLLPDHDEAPVAQSS